MVEAILENGKTMRIEEGGDTIIFMLYDENGFLENTIAWDNDSIASMVFE